MHVVSPQIKECWLCQSTAEKLQHFGGDSVPFYGSILCLGCLPLLSVWPETCVGGKIKSGCWGWMIFVKEWDRSRNSEEEEWSHYGIFLLPFIIWSALIGVVHFCLNHKGIFYLQTTIYILNYPRWKKLPLSFCCNIGSPYMVICWFVVFYLFVC